MLQRSQPDKQTAEKLYFEAQETIKTDDCDISAYRFFVPQQLTTPRPWYVMVIGEKPSVALYQCLALILGQGEMSTIPRAGCRRTLQAAFATEPKRFLGGGAL